MSKTGDKVLALVRPARVLPQLREMLPEAMSLCALISFEHGQKNAPGNTMPQLLDIVTVPDCQARPFERCITLSRHMSTRTMPEESHPLDTALELEGQAAPLLATGLEDRLKDWTGYLDWAEEQILGISPWARLGSGEWDGRVWTGQIVLQDAQKAKAFAPAPEAGRGERFDLVQMATPWQLVRAGDAQRGIACKTLVLQPSDNTPEAPSDCPWAKPIVRTVRLTFEERNAARAASLDGKAPIAVIKTAPDMPNIDRGRLALKELQLLRPYGGPRKKESDKPRYKLTAAPYLMASLFNVKEAAVPAGGSGRFVNRDIARTYRLNADQEAAVEVMLATPEIAYVQGPPGTGKTTMIAAACAHFVRAGKRVLISSQTHLAVDNALERMRGDPEVRPLRLRGDDGAAREAAETAASARWCCGPCRAEGLGTIPGLVA
ncbi:hypothetical protein MASR1M32_32180 [Rhodobacter sp.]